MSSTEKWDRLRVYPIFSSKSIEPGTFYPLAGQNSANRGVVASHGTGTPMAPINENQLKNQYDKSRAASQAAIDAGRSEVKAGQTTRKQDFVEAGDNVSNAHLLGYQGDGRSGAQQGRDEVERVKDGK